MIDDKDREILNILQRNARASNASIAREVDMAPSAVHDRVRKLESRGVIRGYHADINPCAVDRSLLAYIFVRTDERAGEVVAGEALAMIPEVQAVHHVAGEDCYMVKVRIASPGRLARLLRESFGSIATVSSTRTTVVLESVKENGLLLLEPCTLEEATND